MGDKTGIVPVMGYSLSLPFRHFWRYLLVAGPWIGLNIWMVAQFIDAPPLISSDGQPIPGRVSMTWPIGLTLIGNILSFLIFATLWLRISYFSPILAPNIVTRHLGRGVLRLVWTSIKIGLLLFGCAIVYMLVMWLLTSLIPAASAQTVIGLIVLIVYAVGMLWASARFAVALVSAAVDESPTGVLDGWRLGKPHAIRIAMATILLSLLTAVIKAGLWSAVFGVNMPFLVFIAMSPFQSQAMLAGFAPIWFIAIDVVVGCLGITWITAFVARSYRQTTPPAADTRAAEIF